MTPAGNDAHAVASVAGRAREDGFELTFGVNHLGPFFLTHAHEHLHPLQIHPCFKHAHSNPISTNWHEGQLKMPRAAPVKAERPVHQPPKPGKYARYS